MRLSTFFTFYFILFLAACASKEKVELRKENVKKLQQDIVPYGRIKLTCTMAGTEVLPVKEEKYTMLVEKVTGTEKKGSFEHCWSDAYGNEWCNEIETKKDITTMVPMEKTRDKNLSKRKEFVDACGCKNKDYQYLVGKDFEIGDITYSAEYLSKEWQNCVIGRYGKHGPCKNTESGQYGVADTMLYAEKKKKWRLEHCEGKEDHFKKQTWYKKIPIVD